MRSALAQTAPSRRSLVPTVRFLLVAAQVGLLVLIARLFRIESEAFVHILELAFWGLLLTWVVPDRFRITAFAALSLFGIVSVFGLTQGGWFVAIGLGLIGITRLPVSFAGRIVLLMIAGMVLAATRVDLLPHAWSSAIWPILGAMFMFRLITYMYDLRTRSGDFGLGKTLSYFFMLPTLCFPIFPIIDYKQFSKSTLTELNFETQQDGVVMMLRGIVHLLLYRWIYQHWAIDSASITTALDALQYLVYPYLLYLKISGSFHVAIGILNLFGFRLPRSNNYYFLATSFTDYWRRINIYWKDFIQKILFQPVYVRLGRRMRPVTALVAATLVAFIATWALHSYQWFWIRGSFPVIWQDLTFWTIMGAALIVNLLLENRFGRKRSLKSAKRTHTMRLVIALKTVVFFTTAALLWALWAAESPEQLQHALGRLADATASDVVVIGAFAMGLGTVAVIVDEFQNRSKEKGSAAPSAEPQPAHWALRTAPVMAVCAAILAAGYGSLLFYYPAAIANVVDDLKNPLRLSKVDAQAMDRGYYENLTEVGRFNPELAKLYEDRPPDWERCWAMHRTGSFPTHELLPSRSVAFKNAVFTTNRWGMRDRGYELSKPVGATRIAIIGASYSMGAGVNDHETYENIVEDRLNSAGYGNSYELLNFSVSAYGPLSRMRKIEDQVLQFQPDMIIIVGINDLRWLEIEMMKAVNDGVRIPFQPVEDVLTQASIEPGMSGDVATLRLRPYSGELLKRVYQRINQMADTVNSRALLMVVPRLRQESADWNEEVSLQIDVARLAGLDVIDIRSTFSDINSLQDYWLAPWDSHPNAEGHKVLAGSFYSELAPLVESFTVRQSAKEIADD